MTLLGVLFWGICIIAVVIAFFLEKKYGAKAIEKNPRQLQNEEITRETHNNDRPSL